ncbi:unnamed protein product, partial [Mesorhabditis spiculigera]
MLFITVVFAAFFALTFAEAPRATGLRPKGRPNDIRRAPPNLNYDKDLLENPDLPRAKGFRKASARPVVFQTPTNRPRPRQNLAPPRQMRPQPGFPAMMGVRMAPQQVRGQPTAPAHQIPVFVPMLPMPMPSQVATQASHLEPMALSEVSTHRIPTLQDLGFATIALPTLPPLTMPPSFQRLMGITTTSKPKPQGNSIVMTPDEYEKLRSGAYGTKTSTDDEDTSSAGRSPPAKLRSVAERLPDTPSSRGSAETPETDADWMVPL